MSEKIKKQMEFMKSNEDANYRDEQIVYLHDLIKGLENRIIELEKTNR